MGSPSERRKRFIVERVGDREPLMATLESVASPFLARLPEEARKVLVADGMAPETLMLTMPDGSEWLIDDEAWEMVHRLVVESRAYFAEQAAG